MRFCSTRQPEALVAILCLSSSSRRMNGTQTEDKLDSFPTSMCIYQFNCICGDSYIGRTTRQLSQCITEHHTSWQFVKGQTKTIRRSVLSHLVDSGHRVERTKAFKVIHRIPPNLLNGLRVRLLHIAESIGIRTTKPRLCIRKKFVQPLSLPWPT